MQYGKALRATGQKSQAVAVLEQATIALPKNKALLAGYGRALADNGNFQQAFDVLGQAHTPDNPDWRILSAQGAVLLRQAHWTMVHARIEFCAVRGRERGSSGNVGAFGSRAGRSSRHVQSAGSLSSRQRISFVPWRKREPCTLS